MAIDEIGQRRVWRTAMEGDEWCQFRNKQDRRKDTGKTREVEDLTASEPVNDRLTDAVDYGQRSFIKKLAH